MAWTKSTTTKHTCGGPSFGRLTAGCARCDELLSGAAPVQWAGKRTALYDDRNDYRTHDCVKSNCAVVCTYGEW